jgi:hypothetical protein
VEARLSLAWVEVDGTEAGVTTDAAGAMVRAMGPLVASGVIPLLAVTVKVKVPGVVRVPARSPALLRVIPAGNDPEETANVGAGIPVAVKV